MKDKLQFLEYPYKNPGLLDDSYKMSKEAGPQLIPFI